VLAGKRDEPVTVRVERGVGGEGDRACAGRRFFSTLAQAFLRYHCPVARLS
jgi:hypothetical protein